MTKRLIDLSVLSDALHPHNANREILSTLPANLLLSIDSRTFAKGEIFIAMRGDIDDGHKYIADVAKLGASLIIAEERYREQISSTTPTIFVNDTLKLFGEIARIHLQRRKNLIKIAITGSNGKTTTKEMLKAALSRIAGERAVYASVGNKNNLFGLPLCALEVDDSHRFAIFEMGMNQVGEMARLCEVICPDVGIITNISGAHAGNFVDGVDGIAREKGQIFCSVAKTNGDVVVNVDDHRINSLAKSLTFKSQTTFSSGNPNANVAMLSSTPYSLAMGAQTVRLLVDDCPLEVIVPLAGRQHATNATATIAVVKALGLPLAEAALGIKDMQKVSGRMSINMAKDGVLVINDGYNANPASMKAGIMASLDLPARRRIAVIGTMAELGKYSKDLHVELGQLLADHFDHIFLCGEQSSNIEAGIKHNATIDKKILSRSSSIELIQPLKAFVQKGDLVFIKGSLSANMQPVALALLSD